MEQQPKTGKPKTSKTVKSMSKHPVSKPLQPDALNWEQQKAVKHSSGPLLIIAGAETGKTKTLVHRVARLIDQGIEPGRILLLTFTRRVASEMLYRVERLLRFAFG